MVGIVFQFLLKVLYSAFKEGFVCVGEVKFCSIQRENPLPWDPIFFLQVSFPVSYFADDSVDPFGRVVVAVVQEPYFIPFGRNDCGVSGCGEQLHMRGPSVGGFLVYARKGQLLLRGSLFGVLQFFCGYSLVVFGEADGGLCKSP